LNLHYNCFTVYCPAFVFLKFLMLAKFGKRLGILNSLVIDAVCTSAPQIRENQNENLLEKREFREGSDVIEPMEDTKQAKKKTCKRVSFKEIEELQNMVENANSESFAEREKTESAFLNEAAEVTHEAGNEEQAERVVVDRFLPMPLTPDRRVSDQKLTFQSSELKCESFSSPSKKLRKQEESEKNSTADIEISKNELGLNESCNAEIGKRDSPCEGIKSRKARFKALAAEYEAFEYEYKPAVHRNLPPRRTALGTSSPVLSRNWRSVVTSSENDAVKMTPENDKISYPGEAVELPKNCNQDESVVDDINNDRVVSSVNLQYQSPVERYTEEVRKDCGIEAFVSEKPYINDYVINSPYKFLKQKSDFEGKKTEKMDDEQSNINLLEECRAKNADLSPSAFIPAGLVASLTKQFEGGSQLPGPRFVPSRKFKVGTSGEKVDKAAVNEKLECAIIRKSPQREFAEEPFEILNDKVKRLRSCWEKRVEDAVSKNVELTNDVKAEETSNKEAEIVPSDSSDVETVEKYEEECERKDDSIIEQSQDDSFENCSHNSSVANNVNSDIDYTCTSSVISPEDQMETPVMTKENKPRGSSVLRSVSSYRNHVKNYMSESTPHRLIYKLPQSKNEDASDGQAESMKLDTLLENYHIKADSLRAALKIQLEQIHQASRALNLCQSMQEFRGSREEVDAQKALLLSTERKKCIDQELQRMGICVQNRVDFQPNCPLGTLTVSHISIPLRRDWVNDNINKTDRIMYYFICLLKYRETVHATHMVTSDDGKQAGRLEFTNYFQFTHLPPDFRVTLELYSLITGREEIPHEMKYHINGDSLKKMKCGTVSIGGPSGLMDTRFNMVGQLDICLETMQYIAPVQGVVILNFRCCAENASAVKESGLLNVFDDSKVPHVWHLYYGVLAEGVLKFWRFPEDIQKEPLKVIELQSCINEHVRAESEGLSTRNNLIFLEIPNLESSENTTYKHIFSADNDEEYIRWVDSLERALHHTRLWRVDDGMKTGSIAL
ncbi:Actin-binding protein anillin, partial [Trichinella nativa]